MKKILFMIPTLDHGGAEKVLVNLANNLNPDEYDVTVHTLFGGGVNRQFLKPHIKNKYCIKKIFPANTKYFKLFSPEHLFKKYIKEKYDIIVSYLEGPTARIVAGCPYEDTKLVSWIHVQQDSIETACSSFRNYKEAMRCYSKYHRTICVSEYVKNNFLGNFPVKNPVEVLYNTNETAEIIEKSYEEQDKIKNDDYINICAIGTLKKSKGFDKLARIHKKFLDENIKQRVYILGTGPERENLENYIKDNNLQDTFVLLGYDTNPYKYLKTSDMFVCSSIAEGFSTAATEALIVGTPVVTVEVSGMKEMLGENNEYGIVTENSEDALYEGIKTMLTTPGMLEDYASRALERGKRFSTEKTVQAVEDMFANL